MLTTPSSHRPGSPRRRGRRRGEEMLAPPGLVDVDVTDSSPHHSPQLAERMPQHPGWIRVEPWNALLCGGAGAGSKENSADVANRRRAEELQDRKLAEAVPREHEKIAIPQDVRRTRSDTAAFHGEEAKGWLQRCVALFCRERDLQYTQGLTELAAPWALITDPPSLNGFSYRCFCSFVDRFAPNIFTTAPEKAPTKGGQRAFVVLEVHLLVLEQLLRYHDPPLAAHFEDCHISADAYATSWFVTLFARQTPVPVLLYLWQRLVEYGDPVLHQFLALAWLVNSRLLLLETSRDDVPERVTKLKMQSEDTVDEVFGTALALRRLTPRRVCRVLKEACYGGGEGAAPAEWEVSLQGTTNLRVAMLESLRMAGIVMVDAAQVAEILLASSPTGAERRGGSRCGGEAAESKEGFSWGAARNGGRFVLLDCRPQGVAAAAASSYGIAETEAAIEAGEKSAERGEVIWRRIEPKDYLGKNSTALAELLREVSVPAREVEAEGGGELPDIGHLVGLETSGHRSADKSAAAAAIDRGGGAATHVCFVGTGHQGGKSGSGRTYGATVTAAGTPECRLARAASCSCLTSHVCVLEGGFPALEAALRQRSSEGGNAPLRSAVVTPLVSDGALDAPVLSASPQEAMGADASRVGASVELFSRLGTEDIDLADATYVATTGVSVTNQTEVGAAAATAVAAVEGPPAGETSQLAPGKTTPSESPTPGEAPSASEESRVPLPPPLVTTPVQTLEKKMSRLACSSKISEPFRAYAAKSADEMRRGLRSLPLTASRPLENSARVCNSLAKANVKVLGDGRLSLSRSISRLEQLDARMGGTAKGFARNFGAGLHQK